MIMNLSCQENNYFMKFLYANLSAGLAAYRLFSTTYERIDQNGWVSNYHDAY
jgi:hypothetical protein